jgi:SulP family sulfate permease
VTSSSQRSPAKPSWVDRAFPGIAGYDRSLFGDDLRAGIVVAVMLVPQAMAYAAIAGMPPITGLYASTVPLVVYALLGTSRQLAVGPVAIVSLLTAAGLAPLAEGDPARYAQLAALLAVMVGVLQVTFGLFKLGALTNLLSHPVLAGFTSGAALIIGTSQIRSLLGLDVPRSEGFLESVADAIEGLGTLSLETTLISAVAIGLLALGRRRWPRFPMPLVVAVLGIGAVVVGDLADAGVKVIGEVPSGLPAPQWFTIAMDDLRSLVPTALTIAFIGYAEGISIAKTMAARTRHRVVANRELIATGAANLAAGLFQAFPVAGGFSRTAVNAQAGARTNLAGLITAVGVALSLVLLTPLFVNLPQAVLAAIVIVAVSTLVDLRSIGTAFRIRRADGIAQALTFLGTLVLGVELGIGVGVVASLALFVRSTASPHSTEIGRVIGTQTYRNVDRYDTTTDPSIVLLRLDGPLYFANIGHLRDRLLGLARKHPDAEVLVLDAAAVSEMDASAVHGLEEILDALDEAGIKLRLATVRGPVRDVIVRSGLWQRIGDASIHPDIASAILAGGYPMDGPLLVPAQDEKPTAIVY